jgi:hypothetical protein
MKMSDSTELDTDPHPDWEKFALAEYAAISQTFSSGLNTMAVLLPLFFLFTGAVLNYVGNLFSGMAKPLSDVAVLTSTVKPDTHPIIFWNNDYRVLQIYFISAIAIVFSVWSLAFVLVFREGARKMLQRANEIDALFPGLPAHRERKLFASLNHWYNNHSRFAPLRILFWSTVVFYIFIFLSYFAIIAAAFRFNRL